MGTQALESLLKVLAVNRAAVGAVPAVIFWAMDAKYLRLEKMFRSLYDDVRKGVVTEPFDMNFMRYDETVDEPAVVAFSWSVRWFYLTLIVILVVLSIFN